MGFDVSFSFLLLILLNTSSYFASAGGLAIGVVVAYVGHEKFSFGNNSSSLSFSRFAGCCGSSLAVLLIRWGGMLCIDQLDLLTTPVQKIISIISVSGISFVVNYFFSKFYVFRNSKKEKRSI